MMFQRELGLSRGVVSYGQAFPSCSPVLSFVGGGQSREASTVRKVWWYQPCVSAVVTGPGSGIEHLRESPRRWFSVLWLSQRHSSLRDTVLIPSNLPKSLSGFVVFLFPLKPEEMCDLVVSAQLFLACSPVKFSAKDIRLSFVLFGVFPSWFHCFSFFPTFLTSSCKSLEVFRRLRNTRQQQF